MDREVLMSVSHYKQKYYINPKFEGLPSEILNETKELCISLTEKLGGIVTIGFNPEGDIFLSITAEEDDFQFDQIGAELELKEARQENKEKFKMMKLWYLMYQTDYGAIYRQAMDLYHNKGNTYDEIVDKLTKEYGEHMKAAIVETMELISK